MLGCASTAPNHIMTHQNIGGLKSIEKIMKEAHFTEFVIRLNDDNWMGQTTHIRLFQAQRQVGLNTPIFLASACDLIDWVLPGNLNYNILTELKAQLYSFNATRVLDDWKEIHCSLSMNKFLNNALRSYDSLEVSKVKHSFYDDRGDNTS